MATLLEILADGESKTLSKLTALLQLDSMALQEEIQHLRQQGIRIDIEQDNIRLIPQLQRLDLIQLRQALAPYQVSIKPVINSTNQYILDNLGRLNKGDLCLAEHQTAGRGRRGRQWLSPFAGQVILSFYWTFEPKKSVEGLSLVIGMAMVDTLKQVGAYGVSLKWPNDVLLNGR
ncbi:MAG TPA: biotin--[acetyl-CoA-carboxylase] ligase, partial [Pasteurellaceae bacterium]|nr:biotin--[acetyl-CoA-carboxylase] ligase [Pasteurellaceae bacterium]